MMTFAQWQRSRGITPWTQVHRWNELQYLAGLLWRRLVRLLTPVVTWFENVLVPAVTRAAQQLTAFADAFITALAPYN